MEQIGRLQLLGMLLGVNEWSQSFHTRLTLPPSCVEEVATEMEDAVEVRQLQHVVVWKLLVK